MRTATAAALALAVAFPPAATAQIYEAVGTRAQGMGGAFVAVADDATATWWNPAGLATGAFLSLVVDFGRLEEPSARAADGAGWQGRTQGFSVVFPALGLSRYRLQVSEIGPPPPTDEEPPDRQDGEAGGPVVRSLVASQYGVTIGQSLGRHLVVASTLKLVRGGLASSETGAADPFKRAEDLDVRLHTRGDIDVGAMASLGALRLGVSIRNMREPGFGRGNDRLTLRRQARVGAAVVTTARGETVTAAFDADVTRTPTATGDARHAAAGIETWLFQRRLGLRGGVSVSTLGPASQAASAGASVAVRRGLHLDAAVTVGSDRARKGWAIGLSSTF